MVVILILHNGIIVVIVVILSILFIVRRIIIQRHHCFDDTLGGNVWNCLALVSILLTASALSVHLDLLLMGGLVNVVLDSELLESYFLQLESIGRLPTGLDLLTILVVIVQTLRTPATHSF